MNFARGNVRPAKASGIQTAHPAEPYPFAIPQGEGTQNARLWPRVEMARSFVLSELHHILLVRLCRVEIAKSDRHNRFSHRCKLAKHLSRAQPRETIRDAKSAHAPAPLRKKVESKFRRGKSGNFGDLSRGPLFVFCEIRCVLIPEFGDLICALARAKTGTQL